MSDIGEMIGKKIKIREAHKEAFEGIDSDFERARILITQGSSAHRYASKMLWETLHEIYPEVKPYYATYNWSTGILKIIAKLPKGWDSAPGNETDKD